MNTRQIGAPVRIGFISLSIELYKKLIPEYIPIYEGFHGQFRQTLAGMGEVVTDAFCFRREEIEAAVRRMEAAEVDALVVVFASYAPSLNSLAPLVRTSLPLLIWNTQTLRTIDAGFNARQRCENHGMQGPQDLCNGLRRARRIYGIVSGHYQDPDHLRDVAGWLRAAQAVSLSRRLKVGLIGGPFQGMGDFGVDETVMAATWGPTVEHLSLDDLAEGLKGVGDEATAAEMAADREQFELAADVDEATHRCSARLSVVLRHIAQERGLGAVTMNFTAFGGDPRIETIPYLGLNHLIAEGHGYAGEGNVTTAALDALLSRLFGRSNFCEMFTPDFDNNRIFFYHMAEGNYAMARPGIRPRLIKVPFFSESTRPYLTPVYPYGSGPSTFVNITTDPDGRFYLIAFKGELVDFTADEPMTAPYFMMQPTRPIGEFLDAYGMAGGTHHLCRVEGDRLREVGHMAHMLGMELKVL